MDLNSSNIAVSSEWSPETTGTERDRVRALHKAVRSDTSSGERYRILAWGFLRGFPYRRMEPTHHRQLVGDHDLWGGFETAAYRDDDGKWWYEHNFPSAYVLAHHLAKHLPEIAAEIDGYKLRKDWKGASIVAWLTAGRPGVAK